MTSGLNRDQLLIEVQAIVRTAVAFTDKTIVHC